MKTYFLDFNKAAYAGKSKAEFLEAEKHHGEISEVDLSAEYDKMFPAKEKATKELPKEKGE